MKRKSKSTRQKKREVIQYKGPSKRDLQYSAFVLNTIYDLKLKPSDLVIKDIQ